MVLGLTGTRLSQPREREEAAPSGETGRAQRANRRARKIWRRLGGSNCLIEEFPPRPRGMHWATYRRLEALEAAADNQWMAAVVARFGPSKERRKP